MRNSQKQWRLHATNGMAATVTLNLTLLAGGSEAVDLAHKIHSNQDEVTSLK